MIAAEWKPIPELVGKLCGHKAVLLVGCATCVAECSAGGEREVETLAPLLTLALRQRGAEVHIRTKVLERQCEWEFVEELAEMIPNVDAVMSLACGIGVQALAERFKDVPVYPGVNTTMLAIRQEPGLWESRCAACGDCTLDDTYGLCVVARCAKSLMNGPCGGTRPDGKCEVNGEADCVWQLIVDRARSCRQLEKLRKIRPTKSGSNSGQGGQKRVLREDLRP